MAKNTIEIDVKVDDKGTTKKVALGAKKAAEGLDKTGTAADRYNKKAKGVGQAGLSAGKGFSKMSQGMGGLVAVYATLAANIFALTAAFGALSRAAQLDELESSLLRVGAASGKNLKGLAADITSITGAAISSREALSQVATATTQGFSGRQLKDLATIAKGASIALGRDLPDSLDRLVRGTAKLEPEILDELGIIVRLDDATRDYAETLGKTAKELTAYERQQAFANAVSEQGLKKFGAIAEAANTNPYSRLSASFDNVTQSLLSFLNVGLIPIAEFLSKNLTALIAVLAISAGGIFKAFLPGLGSMADAAESTFERVSESASRAAKESASAFSKAAKGFGADAGKLAPASIKKLQDEISTTGQGSPASYAAAEKSLKGSITRRKNTLRQFRAEVKTLNGQEKIELNEKIRLKEVELSQIERLQAETRELRAIQNAPGGTTASSAKAQAAAYSKTVAGIQKNALADMQGVGGFGGFGIASEAFSKLKVEAAGADKSIGGFKAGLKAAAGSSKLFGAALLTALPMIGLITIAISAAFSAIQYFVEASKSFGDRAFEAIKDKVKGVTESVLAMEKAMLLAKTTAEKMFIAFKGKTGITEQVVDNFEALVLEAKKGKQENVANQVKRYIEERNKNSRSGIAAISQQRIMQEAKAEKLLFDIVQLQVLAEQSRAQLLDAGAVKSSEEIKAFDTLLAELAETNEGTWDEKRVLAFAESIRDIVEPSNKVIASIEGINDAVSNVDKSFTKLAGKSDTKYTDIINNYQALQNELTTLATNPELSFSTLSAQGGPAGDMIDEKVANMPRTVSFLPTTGTKFFSESEGDYAKRIMDAILQDADNLAANFKAADDALRSMNSKLATNKTELEKISSVSKNSVFLTAEKIKLEKKANQIRIDGLEAARTALGNSNKTEEERLQIGEQIAALVADNTRLANDALVPAQAAFNQATERAKVIGIQNKLLREQFDIEQKNLKTRQSAATREAKGANRFFEYTDRGKSKIDDEIVVLEAKIKFEKDNAEKINAMKKALIQAEYALLAAQLTAAAEIARSRGGEAAETEASRLKDLAKNINTASKTAGDQITAASTASVAGLEEELEVLKRSRSELEDFSLIAQAAADGFAQGMTSAFDGLIQGTMNAKEAFANMAKSMLSMIAKVITELLVAKLLTAALGGTSFGGFLGIGARTGGVLEPKVRTGGVLSEGRKLPGYSAGGIARGKEAGYPAVLHGTEAVVPLPNGRSIPVEMQGANQMNNVTVNVSVDSNGNAQQGSQSNGKQGESLGAAIATAVQKELQNQKRSGGILNPYGVA